MYNKLFSVVYAVNYIIQAIFVMLTPVAVMAGIAWILTEKVHMKEWVWAVAILLGLIMGVYSMVRYIMRMNNTNNKDAKNNGK